MTTPLDVLLIEAHPGDGAVDSDRLVAAGHRVHRCWSERSDAGWRTRDRGGSLCVGVTAGSCPVDRGIDVALVVRGRVTPRPTAAEAGASCALRSGIPVVEDGPETLDPFEPWLAARAGEDVVVACEEAVQLGLDPLRPEIVARTSQVLAGAGVDPRQVQVAFELEPPRLTVRLRGPAVSAAVEQALGVRVLDAVRAARRTFGQVDVSYEPVEL